MNDNKTRTLARDVEIPYLGFGTYLIPDNEAAATDAWARVLAWFDEHLS